MVQLIAKVRANPDVDNVSHCDWKREGFGFSPHPSQSPRYDVSEVHVGGDLL